MRVSHLCRIHALSRAREHAYTTLKRQNMDGRQGEHDGLAVSILPTSQAVPALFLLQSAAGIIQQIGHVDAIRVRFSIHGLFRP